MHALTEAKKQIEQQHLGKGGCHTVAIGYNEEAGEDTGDIAVVCYVGRKLPAGRLVAQGQAVIPPVVQIGQISVLTDVQEMPPPRDLRLYRHQRDAYTSQRVTSHRQCHDAPIPGGVQIAPKGAPWVGTLSGALRYQASGGWRYGALTNAHVSGMNAEGKQMCQPSGNSGWFAKIHRVVDIRFDGQPNYIDAAILDVERTDGKFSPVTHTVQPVQLDIGKLKPSIKKPQLGDRVIKSGRTTGVTRGRCVGVEATSHVGYEEGTAKFERQLIVRADSGEFSAGGDSGSLVLFESTRQPWGLLFAGGGGQTICNPIGFVLDWGNAEFYEV